MSTPRYDWWPYVKGMIRRYPELRSRDADLHTTAAPRTMAARLAAMAAGPTLWQTPPCGASGRHGRVRQGWRVIT